MAGKAVTRKKRSAPNGAGSAFQCKKGRHKGRWVGQVTIGRKPNGRPLYDSRYFDSWKDANDWRMERVQQRDREAGCVAPSTDKLTVEAFFHLWFEQVIVPNKAPKTTTSYAQIARLHILPELGRLQLDKLTPLVVVGLLNRKRAAGVGKRTIQYAHTLLHAACKQAVNWRMLRENPLDFVERPTTDKRLPVFFNPEQARSFLAAIEGHNHEAIFVLSLAEGLRQGEVLGLEWSAVDLEAATIVVRTSLQRNDGKLALKKPKNDSSHATIPISQLSVLALRRHRDRQDELRRRRLRGTWVESDLVFTSITGTPLEPSNIVKRFKDVLKRTGLPNIRFQDLRRSCATLMIANDENPRVVMEKLRHSDIGVTMNIYASVIKDQQRAASSNMDRLLSPPAISTAPAGEEVYSDVYSYPTEGDPTQRTMRTIRRRMRRTQRTSGTTNNQADIPRIETLDQ